MNIFTPDYFEHDGVYEHLLEKTPWVNRDAPRDECFMALDTSLTYSYGKGTNRRTYTSSPMDSKVKSFMEHLNESTKSSFNVCVLNYYSDQHQHLGWHADDSPEQDPNHPIAVVSFGASRYIWIKRQDEKGKIPDEQKFLLTPGSLFWMPAGFQETHYHRIPKHDRPCEGRISITYRKLDR